MSNENLYRLAMAIHRGTFKPRIVVVSEGSVSYTKVVDEAQADSSTGRTRDEPERVR